MDKYIVGHISLDWDCIAGIWLLKRFTDLSDYEVVFVNTGAPDPAILAQAAAVVDTGREYDTGRRRFDHHHMPGRAASETSATLLVFYSLTDGGKPLHPLFYLNQIAALVTSGDTGRTTDGADWSRIEGIHALLSAQKARKLSDDALLSWGFDILDLLAESSQARYAAQKALAAHIVYRSDDGLLVALRDAPQHTTFAAMEAGARLVVFSNYAENTIGVMRAGEWQEPHCGGLVLGVLNDAECGVGPVIHGDPVFLELASWFRHNAGFCALRGTKKAPREDPVIVDLVDVARALDWQWKR